MCRGNRLHLGFGPGGEIWCLSRAVSGGPSQWQAEGWQFEGFFLATTRELLLNKISVSDKHRIICMYIYNYEYIKIHHVLWPADLKFQNSGRTCVVHPEIERFYAKLHPRSDSSRNLFLYVRDVNHPISKVIETFDRRRMALADSAMDTVNGFRELPTWSFNSFRKFTNTEFSGQQQTTTNISVFF